MFKVGDRIRNDNLVGDVVQYQPKMFYHTGVVFVGCSEVLIWHNNEMLSKFILDGKLILQPGDKVKSTYNDQVRILKVRLPDHDDNELGECWEFEEDEINSTDWINHYEFVERRVVNEERYYCTNCRIPTKSAEQHLCSGGCAQEMSEREML